MNTVIIQGLKNNKLIAQGYGLQGYYEFIITETRARYTVEEAGPRYLVTESTPRYQVEEA